MTWVSVQMSSNLTRATFRKDKTMRLLMRMTPIKVGKYQERVAIYTKLPNSEAEYYPLAFTHIDTFYGGKALDNSLYDKLNAGETVYIDAYLAVLSAGDIE